MNSGLWSRPNPHDYVLHWKEKKRGWYVSDDYIKVWNKPFEGWKWGGSSVKTKDLLLPPEMMEPLV